MNIKHKLNIILYFFLIFIATSCSDDSEYNRNSRLLGSQNWELNTFVDYSQNQTTEFRPVAYYFKDDDILLKIYEGNDTVVSYWNLSADGDYITIGSNTFKITDISRRVLSLKYGEIEMFFVAQ